MQRRIREEIGIQRAYLNAIRESSNHCNHQSCYDSGLAVQEWINQSATIEMPDDAAIAPWHENRAVVEGFSRGERKHHWDRTAIWSIEGVFLRDELAWIVCRDHGESQCPYELPSESSWSR